MANNKKDKKKSKSSGAGKPNRVGKNKGLTKAERVKKREALRKERYDLEQEVREKTALREKWEAQMRALSEKDLNDPRAKETYDKAKAAVESYQESLDTYSNILEKIQKEEEDMTMDDVPAEHGAEENGEGSSSGPAVTFANDSTPGSSSSRGKNRLHPQDDSAQGADPSNPIVIEDELDLIKVHEQLPTSGLPDAEKYRKIVAVKNAVSKGKVAIVQYGPQNSAIYRRQDVTGQEIPPDVPDLSDPADRPGQRATFVDGIKRWELSRQNCVAIQGVAFADTCELKDINPSRKGRGNYAPTDVLIRWKIDGKIEKSWEIRTVFKRVWDKSGDGPDVTIYKAAKVAEQRFEQWKRGVRKAASRTPTPHADLVQSQEGNTRKAKTAKFSEDSGDNSTTDNSDSDDSESEDSDSRKKKKSKAKKKKARGKGKYRKATESDSDENSSSEEDTESEDSDVKSRKKKTRSKRASGKHNKRGQRDDSDTSDSSEDERSTIDPVKWEKAWCLINGKKLQKLSKKDEAKMKRDFRHRKS